MGRGGSGVASSVSSSISSSYSTSSSSSASSSSSSSSIKSASRVLPFARLSSAMFINNPSYSILSSAVSSGYSSTGASLTVRGVCSPVARLSSIFSLILLVLSTFEVVVPELYSGCFPVVFADFFDISVDMMIMIAIIIAAMIANMTGFASMVGNVGLN